MGEQHDDSKFTFPRGINYVSTASPASIDSARSQNPASRAMKIPAHLSSATKTTTHRIAARQCGVEASCEQETAYLLLARLTSSLAELMTCNINVLELLATSFLQLLRLHLAYVAPGMMQPQRPFSQGVSRYGTRLFLHDRYYITPSTCQNYWLLTACQ